MVVYTSFYYSIPSSNGSGNGYIFFGETECQGDELSLIECETDIHNRDLCDHQHDVWITCCKCTHHVMYNVLLVLL